MARLDLTVDRLRAALHYDPETGVFVRLTKSATSAVGDVAGYTDRKGYVRIKVGRETYFAHRLAWLYVFGSWPIAQIDHKNMAKSDNALHNLRDVSNQTNAQNKHTPTRVNKAGLLGVHWRPECNSWKAQISIAGKKTHIGHYPTAELAHEAYLKAKREHHAGFI